MIDNNNNNDATRIAREIWDDVVKNDLNSNDLGDSMWPQIVEKIRNEVPNDDLALEIREIIWEEYVPVWEKYIPKEDK